MTRYEVKLTEQEVLNLRQLISQPGAEVIFKLLQVESLDAQSKAMECSGSQEQRLLALSDAQSTARIVSNLTRKLAAYGRQIEVATPEEIDPLEFSWGTKKEAN